MKRHPDNEPLKGKHAPSANLSAFYILINLKSGTIPRIKEHLSITLLGAISEFGGSVRRDMNGAWSFTAGGKMAVLSVLLSYRDRESLCRRHTLG